MGKRKAVESGFVCTAAVLALGQSSTQAVTFTSSTLRAFVGVNGAESDITTLPAVTPFMFTDDNGQSTVSPDFTGLVFKTSFDQTLYTAASASGESNTNFIGGAGDTYSLFGSTAPVGGTSMFTVSLRDNTTSTYLYSAGGGPLTIGSSVGSLTADDSYTFDLYDELDASALVPSVFTPDASLAIASNTGSGGITIVPGVTPEPGTAELLGVCVLTAAGFQRFFRTRATV